MTISRPRGHRWPGVLAVTLVASTLGASGPPEAIVALELDVNAARIDAGLRIARGPEAGRAAFHRPYLFATGDVSVDRVEVITEYRRLVLMGQERLAIGDHMFEQGGRLVEEALRPWRRRVSLIANLHFSPQNAYVSAPQLDIVLVGASGNVPRLDLRNTTQFGSGAASQIMGVDGEALFDATAIGQTVRTAIARVNGKDVAKVTIDFSRLN